MSTTIDQRVVEMRFDNAQFENNVKTSMSTLEKLKQSLNLNGAAKGLDSISKAANGVNLTGISTAVGALETKFSALEVMGITALTNITNSAVNAGKKVVSALTIDPIKTGFQEYETQINAVQTILANTKSKGSTIDDVNQALRELNDYADLTIYNFTEMTRNIGTFTAAGVDLETSVNAIQGIANLAAVSGSTSQQASTAMYQLSQALAAGTVKLMDWNSVVNAGMGGEVFQTALKKTSEELKTGAEAAIKAKGSFRESLQTGWLTSEVLTETLKKFTTSGANEYVAEYIGQSPEVVKAALKNAEAKYGEAEAIKYASKELANNYDKNEDEIRQALEMAQTATDAATKVKTFTQLWDVMKEAAQSGWAQTWQLIIGDFEQAKDLLTPLSDFFTDIIGKISDTRNTILAGALNSPFAKAFEGIDRVAKSVDTVTKAVENYGEVVDKVIGGEYGSGQSRWDKLAKEGYDWAKVQNMVNEKLGSSVRHTEQLKEANDDLNKSKGTALDQLSKMSDAQLKNIGLEEDEIKSFRELQKYADKTGLSLEEIAKNTDSLSGRTLLINSFKNAGKGLATVFTAMASAWKNVFPPLSIEERSQKLYDMIAAVHKFSTNLIASEETADKFYRTFRGVISILKITRTVVGGPLSVAFKAFKAILEVFDIDILDLTAKVGDAIYQFSEWLDSATDFTAIFEAMKPYIEDATDAIKEFSESIKNSRYVAEAIEWIRDALLGLKDVDLTEVGRNIIEGLKKGLSEGAVGSIVDFIVDLGKQIIDRFCEVLGIQSPSKVFMAIGGFIVAGLLIGLNAGVPEVREFFAGLGEKLKESFSNIDWKNVFAVGVSAAMLGLVKKLAGTLDKFASPLEGLGELLENTGTSLLNFSKAAKSFAFKFRAEGIKDIAIALAVLVGVVIALAYFVHKVDDIGAIVTAVVLVGVLAGVLTALAFAVSKMSQASIELSKNGIKIGSLATTLIGISLSILLLAQAVKAMGMLKETEIEQGFNSLYKMIASMMAFVAIYGLLVNTMKSANISKLGSMLIKMSIAMLLMVGVVKLANMLEYSEMFKGAIFAGAFLVFTLLLAKITNKASFNANKLGTMLLKISFAMLLMVGICKLASTLNAEDMFKGAIFATAFVLFVKGLVKVTQIGSDKQLAKLGGLLLSISISMLLMVGVCKLVGMLSFEDMVKGGIAIAAFMGIVYGMCKIVKMVGSDAPKIAATILAMSVAIGILAGVAILLSLIDLGGLAKGIAAIGMLSVFMSMMIAVTRLATNCKGELIVLTAAIALMAIAVAGLSMIDPKKLFGAVAALSILMGMFALMEKASGGIQGSLKSMMSLLLLAGVVAALAGILKALSSLDTEASVKSAAAISILLVTMSGSMRLLNSVGANAIKGVLYLVPLTLVVTGLATILGVMSHLNVEGSMQSALAISTLLLAMSGALVILNFVGPMATTGVICLLALTLVVAGIAGILYMIQDLPIASTIVNAVALSTLLLAMSAACAIVGLIPAAAAIQGALGLAGFVAIITGVIAAIGALSKIPGFNELIASGGDTLALVGTAIGKFVGSIVGGFGEGLSSSLPAIGANLSMFMTNLTPFLNGIKMVDSSVLASTGYLSGAIIALTTADMINGLVSFLNNGSSLADLGAQLSAFMTSAMPFIQSASMIDEGTINSAKMIADLTMTLTAADLLSAITSFITGSSSFETFGTQLTAFGKAIVGFSNTVSAGGGINETAVNAAANAGSMMVELQSKLINTGGVVQWFTGEKNMATFGTQLVAFGKAIVGFSKTVSEGGINESAIVAAANAGSIMAKLQNNLEPTNGVFQFFTGQKNLATFGTQLVAFGKAIAEFSEEVTGINGSAVTAAANAGLIMAKVQKAIPKKKWFDGTVSLSSFGKKIKGFGEKMADFSDEVSGIDTGAVNTAVTNAQRLASLMRSLKGLDTSGVKSFKSALTELGKVNYSSFAESFKSSVSKMNTIGLNMTTAIANGIRSGRIRVVAEANGLVNSLAQVLSSKKTVLGNFGSSMMDGIVSGINKRRASAVNATVKMVSEMLNAIRGKGTAFGNAGSVIMNRFIAGISKNKSKVSTIMKSMVSSGVASIRSYYTNFYSAGAFCVDGFCLGITANTFRAEAKAAAMASAALEAARKALKEKSPSKAFYEVGDYAGQGFVNALDDSSGTAYDSGFMMADYARKGLSKAVAKIQSLMDTDMDIRPTISPVVDLSNVESGTAAIRGMFGQPMSISATTSLAGMNAVNTVMNRRNQNGSNEDVVAAIDKLRKDVRNLEGTNNTINGLTYGDDSGISEAIGTIVRAARIERRM